MSKFEFIENDNIGKETLNIFAHTNNFNSWMYETISSHCSGRILEIGSGIGNISQYLLKSNSNVVLSDIRTDYLIHLRNRFPTAKRIVKLNLEIIDFSSEAVLDLGQFDTIVALNVIEHIEHDDLAISNCYKLLKPGGKIIILVPAYQIIYNKIDQELAHYKRYSSHSIQKLLIEKHFLVVESKYFNFVGLIGWIFFGIISKQRKLPKRPVGIFEAFVPLFKIIDFLLLNKMGLSVITIAKKNI